MGGLHYTWHFRYFFTSATITAGLTDDRRKFLREANLRFAKLPLNFLTKSLLSLSVRELLTASQRIQFVRAHSKSKYSSRASYRQYKRRRACSSPAFFFFGASFLHLSLHSFVAGTSSQHVLQKPIQLHFHTASIVSSFGLSQNLPHISGCLRAAKALTFSQHLSNASIFSRVIKKNCHHIL